MNILAKWFFPVLLIIGICSGQLIRSCIVFLDLAVIILTIFGALSLRFKFTRPPYWMILGFIFAGLGLFSLVITPLHLTLPDYLNSSLYALRFLLYILLGWEIYSGAFPVIKQFASKIFILSGLILSILGLIQLVVFPDLQFLQTFGWDPHYLRMVSTFLDPNFLGSFLILTMIVSLSSIKNFRKDLLPLLSFTLSFLAVLATFSRSAILMFLVSFLVFAILKRSIKLTGITIILTAILFISFQVYGEYIAKPRNVDRQQSANYRIGSWQTGIKIWQNSPLIGIGFNSYRFALSEYKLAPESFIESHGGSSNDSSLLFVLATTGIIGLICYVLFMLSLVYKSSNKLLMAGLAGLLVNSLFINSLFYVWTLLWIILIASYKSDEFHN